MGTSLVYIALHKYSAESTRRAPEREPENNLGFNAGELHIYIDCTVHQ